MLRLHLWIWLQNRKWKSRMERELIEFWQNWQELAVPARGA